MHPHFEKSTGYLIIEWYEKREKASPIHHYYSFQPSYLQLHPKDPKKVVRATFVDKMPGWMEKYAKEHDFKCQQVTRSGEVGWWIANWRIYPAGYKPFTSPNLNGSFEQLARLIPDVCDEWKSTILDHREVIKQNLRYYPDAYEEFGLYFRPEEINGIGGAIVFEDFIPDRPEDESDEDYRTKIEKDGRLERLIFELVTPLPEPVLEAEDEELVIETDDEEILEIDLVDEEEIVIDGIEFEDVIDEEEGLSLDGFELEDEEPAEGGSFSNPEVTETVEEAMAPESEGDISEDLEEMNESEEEEDAIIDEPQSEEEILSEELPAEEIEVAAKEELAETESSDEELIEQPLFDSELKVADVIDKKVVEGQFSLF
jgi:hypothetical protein